MYHFDTKCKLLLKSQVQFSPKKIVHRLELLKSGNYFLHKIIGLFFGLQCPAFQEGPSNFWVHLGSHFGLKTHFCDKNIISPLNLIMYIFKGSNSLSYLFWDYYRNSMTAWTFACGQFKLGILIFFYSDTIK